MDLLREKLRARGHHRAQFGGDSSSTSTQETNYNFTDNRSVSSVDNHSTNIMTGNTGGTNSIDRSFNTDSFNTTTTTTNTNITQTDHGAVQGALQNNATNTALLFQLADKMLAGNKEITTQNQVLAKELSTTAANAYDGATSQATGNRTMLLIGVAVVGIVAVMAWKNQ